VYTFAISWFHCVYDSLATDITTKAQYHSSLAVQSNGAIQELPVPLSGRVFFTLSCVTAFREVVGLERGPLSLVSIFEELLERKNSGSGLENPDYGRRGSAALTTRHLYPQKLALTSPISGDRSV
jgi:hypothetical protein